MMDDRNLVDLSERRAAKLREQRNARLSLWKPSLSVVMWSGLVVAAALGYFFFGERPQQRADITGTFTYAGKIAECGFIRQTCLVDGDTGWQGGVKWRLQGFDAPEMDDKAACARERELAMRSLQRLTELMVAGYSIAWSGKTDKFKRALVDVKLTDGRDAGSVLLAEGLMQPWPNTGNVWCEGP